jgi:NRAMP (natural resistance-associated macrophage protein)-like metal ion transporter
MRSPEPTTQPTPPASVLAREFFANLGPGLITGAADDDPSGISTYSVTGAQFGLAALWTALFSFPLMCAVQLMCARLGIVSGRGLAGVIRRRYSRWVLWSSCAILLVANVFNIGADLGGMGDALQMVTGIKSYIWSPLLAVAIVASLILISYKRLARIFKWLTLVLFAYVITAFLVRPNWSEVLHATLVPQIQWTKPYLAVLVGILGTTISPYLFFWQASQEVEEEREMGRRSVAARRGATPKEMTSATVDVFTGMFFSNFVMYFIILTTGTTLHAHGITHIDTAKQAAEALRPLAGEQAYLLFTLGIIGTGVLAVPVLAGSSAYAVAESAAWAASLGTRPRLVRKFYWVLGAAVVVGITLEYIGFNAVQMLFYSAVLNGILAAPLIVLVVLLTSDPTVMGDWINPPWMKALGWLAAAVMTFAALAMFVV